MSWQVEEYSFSRHAMLPGATTIPLTKVKIMTVPPCPPKGRAGSHHGLISNVTGAFVSALDLKVTWPELSLRSILTRVPLT